MLNPAGQRLARGIRLAAREIAAALADMATSSDAGGDRIVIGAMPLCRARLLPEAIAALAARAPGVRFDIVEGAWRELLGPLRDGRIDMIVGALRPAEEVPDLQQAPLFDDLMIVVGRGGHPLAGTAPGQVELARYPWIVGRAGSPLRTQWEALFDGALPHAPIECGSVMVIRGILLSGDYLTLLSPDQVGPELEDGLLARIGAPLVDSVRRIGVATRRDWRPTIAQAAFVEALRNVAPPAPTSGI